MSTVLEGQSTTTRSAERQASALVRSYVGRADGLEADAGARRRRRPGWHRGARRAAFSDARSSASQSCGPWTWPIRMMDLTTLEGKDTEGKVRAHMRQGHPSRSVRPDHPQRRGDLHLPGAHPCRQARARGHAASQSPASPPASRRARRISDVKILETRQAVEAGADEIDMVIDRGAFLEGDYRHVFDEIVAVKEACGDAHLKVILETGELETYDNVRRASILAMAAGADFIKTSTGKVQPAATLPVTLVMMEAVRDFHRRTGRIVGIKPAGGIRTAKEAIGYLVVLYETLGPRWMTPELFRFGASSLLNDVLMQIRKERTGRYQGPDYFTVD